MPRWKVKKGEKTYKADKNGYLVYGEAGKGGGVGVEGKLCKGVRKQDWWEENV